MDKNIPFTFCLSYFLKGWKELFFHKAPIFITFFITSKCNANCGHCLYWDKLNRDEEELSLEEVTKISSSMRPFYKLLLSGGEPFLRKDIDEICKIFYINNKVRQITIPTNGISTDKIYTKISSILRSCPEANIQVQISIDGPEQIHDKIRNTPGAFNKMMQTYYALEELEKQYKNLEINFCFTFSLLNEDYMQETSDYLNALGNNSFNLILVRDPVRDKAIMNFDFEKYDKWNNDFMRGMPPGRSSGSERIFAVRRKQQIKIIRNVIKDKKFTFKCSAGTLTAVIDELGMIYPCESSRVAFGSLREEGYNFNQIWHGNIARSFRKAAMAKGCRCTHESNTITNVSFSPGLYLAFLKDYLINKP
jgi:MoaA/NifB/PqqE/SkfB family radical SAM enzyme